MPDAVNSLVNALDCLNAAFANMSSSLAVTSTTPLWHSSLDSLVGRQLKWVYPAVADDDEFLKRATLASTLVIEALETASLRALLCAMGNSLHMSYESKPLGSRNLLQRLDLIALLIEELQPDITDIPLLVKQAEGKDRNVGEPDLQTELESAYRRVRDEFSPLAFLYDLRTFGGLAHAPNKPRAAAAAAQLGLPQENWHRTDYLRLLNLVTDSINRVTNHLEVAVHHIQNKTSRTNHK